MVLKANVLMFGHSLNDLSQEDNSWVLNSWVTSATTVRLAKIGDVMGWERGENIRDLTCSFIPVCCSTWS